MGGESGDGMEAEEGGREQEGSEREREGGGREILHHMLSNMYDYERHGTDRTCSASSHSLYCELRTVSASISRTSGT